MFSAVQPEELCPVDRELTALRPLGLRGRWQHGQPGQHGFLWLECVPVTAFPRLPPALHHAVVLPSHGPPAGELSGPPLLLGRLKPGHGDPHPGGLVPGPGEHRAAVLGTLPEGVSQPAEHEGPAIRQCMGLCWHTHLQLAPILLPEEVNIRRAWEGHNKTFHTGWSGVPGLHLSVAGVHQAGKTNDRAEGLKKLHENNRHLGVLVSGSVCARWRLVQAVG